MNCLTHVLYGEVIFNSIRCVTNEKELGKLEVLMTQFPQTFVIKFGLAMLSKHKIPDK